MESNLEALQPQVALYLKEKYPDLVLDRIDPDGSLHLEALGECASCPYQCLTAERGIEEEVRAAFPDITRVSVIPAISQESIDFAKELLGLK